MKVSYKGFCIVLLLASALGLSACQQDKPAEKAGKKIDQLTMQAEKKIESAGDTLSDKSKKAEEYMDDAAITAKVKAEIVSEPLLKVSQITVTTINGTVKLSGVVDSRPSLDRALQITRNVNNVKSIENDLVVKSSK